MSNDVFREIIAQRQARLGWVHRPTAVARLRTWHLRVSGAAGQPVVEIDTGLMTAEGDRYGEIVGRAAVKTAACMLALSGVEVTLPTGEVFDAGWVGTAVRVVEGE